jgi:hypothetical protein
MTAAGGKGNTGGGFGKTLKPSAAGFDVERVSVLPTSPLASRWRMDGRRLQLWLGLLLGVLWAGAGAARGQGLGLFARSKTEQWQRVRAAALVPLDHVPAEVREEVRLTVERPTLFASGPGESFLCRPDLYFWFLDHPDRAVTAWRRLGAVCLNITERAEGRFGWADDQGNDVWWETIYRSPDVRVWYAQGKVKPSPLLPLVPVRAVVVMRHSRTSEQAEGTVMFHQADVFVHTDSKTAALVTRLMGPSAPRMAEQGIGQMQMFFSALVWYCQRYPARALTVLESLAAPPAPPAPEAPAAPAVKRPRAG